MSMDSMFKGGRKYAGWKTFCRPQQGGRPGRRKMNWFYLWCLRYGIVAVIMVFGLSACSWQGIDQDGSMPKRLYISGQSSHVSDQQIAQIAAPYLRVSLAEVDIEALQKRIASEPWLKDVRVYRRRPDGIVIHVSDRKAIADWGSHGVLAADGTLFSPRQRPENLPKLNGPGTDPMKVYTQYRRLSGILAGHGVHLAALELNASGGWDARLDNGLRLRLGRSHLVQRVQRFVRYALVRPQARRALATAGYVDLRYNDGFAVGGSRKVTVSAHHEESVG